MRKLITAILVALILCIPVYGQEADYSGSFVSQAGVGLPNTHDNKGDFLISQTFFDSTFRAFMGETMLYVNSILMYDALGDQTSNGVSAFVDDDGNFALQLKEAYFDWRGEKLALRVGRQISAWGKADGVQIADILCPQDETKLIASDYKDSRLGIDAVRLSYIGESSQTDFYWIPIFTPSTTPEGIDDYHQPDKGLYSSEYAARFSKYMSAFDFSFYGFYGWEDLPLFSAGGEGRYKRMAMVGADAAIPVGDFVLRTEAAFYPQRYIQKDTGTTRRNQVRALAGFDWTPSGGWTITAQYVADIVSGSDSSLVRHTYEHMATLNIEKPFMNETLTLSADFSCDLRYFSTSTELMAEYKLTDSITLYLIGDFFFAGPEKDGMYGEYKDLSCITIKGKYSF
jgi:hypothetical protein